MKKFRYLLAHYPLTLLCLAVVWYLSLFIIIHKTPLDDVPFIDKWTHMVMYGGTCSVMWWEYARCHDRLHVWKLFLLAWLGPIVMGGVIELLQANCTTNRSGEWLDLAADSVGVTLGVGIGLLIWKYRKRKR